MVHHFRLYREAGGRIPILPVTDTHIALKRSDNGSRKVCKDLLSNRCEIGNIIDDICSRFEITPQYQMTLFAKVFEPHPLYDGTVALIICIATELRTLELDFDDGEPLAMTRHFVTEVDWRHPNATLDRHPLHALKSLHMHEYPGTGRRGQLQWGDFDHVMPGLETLSICNNVYLRSLPHARLRDTDQATLSTLELKDVNIEPCLLLNFIRCACAQNLKELAVIRPGSVPRAWSNLSWDLYDYQSLKKEMLQHIPDLQSFTWLGTAAKRVGKTCGSFAGFTQLKELIVESDLMFGLTFRYQEPQVPSRTILFELFPQSLEIFELSDMSWSQLFAIFDWFQEERDARWIRDELATLSAYISSLPMKEIFFTVNVNPRTVPWESEPLLELLAEVADALEARGTSFSVWYPAYDRLTPLVQPGITYVEECCIDEYEGGNDILEDISDSSW